jgi:hypothetical protein
MFRVFYSDIFSLTHLSMQLKRYGHFQMSVTLQSSDQILALKEPELPTGGKSL